MGRSTGRNLRNRRRKQQIKKRLHQQHKQNKKLQAAATEERHLFVIIDTSNFLARIKLVGFTSADRSRPAF